MRDEMLFIDGELVDIDDDTKIALNYKSNIFSDLSKIVSNNSHTIKLPNTVHNQRVFKHADLPEFGSTYPRSFHKARYFRNGVEILSDALAVLISSGESFDVALTWGNSSVFEPLVKSEKKLNELTDNGEFLIWNKEAGYGELGKGNYLYSQANYGVNINAEGANVWALPVVRIPFIIKLIEKEYGIKINIPYPQNSLTDSLMIMCNSQKESEVVLYKNPYRLRYDGNSSVGMRFQKDTDISTNNYGWISKEYAGDGYFSVFNQSVESDIMHIRGTISVTIGPPSPEASNNSVLYIYHRKPDGTTESYKKNAVMSNIGFFGALFFANIDIPTEKGSKIFFRVSTPGGTTIKDPCTLDIGISFPAVRDVQYNERFPIVPNLIPMKCIDFLKNIAQMVGLFAIPDTDGKSISFFSVDRIYLNIHKAINVTRRVVAETRENKPRSMKYAVAGLARNNRFDYKKDESVLGDYSGVITVADETIDYEKEAVSMSFAATDTISADVGVTIPLYGYNKDGAIERKSIEPRILREDWRNMKSALSFSGMEWKQLLKDYYSRYQKVVSSPIIITEKIELSDIELKELDMTIPFYLGQYGRYYAIISVKAEDTGICECQLLQLEV